MKKSSTFLLAILLLTAFRPTMKERLIKLEDVSLCAESFGDESDPAILLIMGATASMLWWDEEFCERLAAQGFFVIRYDHRDVGRSTTYPPGTPPYGLDEMTDDIFGILDGYGLERAHLAGMSLGGLLAQMAALKYPERVKSLTLIGTGPFGPSDPAIPAMDERILTFQSNASKVDWSDEDAVAAYLVEGAQLLSGPGRPYDIARGEQLARAEFRRANNYISMFNHAKLQGGETYYGRVEEIAQPGLIIHGTADLIWHYRHALTLSKQLQDARLLPLEGAGHELHRQDWDVIVQALSGHAAAAEE